MLQEHQVIVMLMKKIPASKKLAHMVTSIKCVRGQLLTEYSKNNKYIIYTLGEKTNGLRIHS
jgi:hypothetical protein